MRFWAGVLGLGMAGLLVVPAEAAWAIEPHAPLAAPAPAQKVPPKKWARSVCTSLRDWETNIKDLTSEFRSAGGSSTDAAQVKDLLVTYLGNTVSETETLLTQLDQAGTPNFKDGSKVAGLFQNGMTDVRDLRQWATGCREPRHDRSDAVPGGHLRHRQRDHAGWNQALADVQVGGPQVQGREQDPGRGTSL